ncbi:MAG: CoA transferase [Syntrophomonadaceae bacterium]
MAQPLEGIRVIDLCNNIYGQFCTQILADFGAEVIKIESNTSINYVSNDLMKRNKKSFTLNLEKEEGKAVFSRLAEQSDVLVSDGSAPIENTRLIELQKINDKLVYCCISDHIITQNEEDYYQKYLSNSFNLSQPDISILSGIKIANMAGGVLYPVIAILLALISRQNTGKGQTCEVSVTDGALSLLKYVIYQISNNVQECQLI